MKLARDPWHLKALMKDLTDTNSVNLNTTEAEVEGIVRHDFRWREESREIGEEREKEEAARGHTEGMEN